MNKSIYLVNVIDCYFNTEEVKFKKQTQVRRREVLEIISTSHVLNRELLNKSDGFITATLSKEDTQIMMLQ